MIVCSCYGTSHATVADAIEKGARTLHDIEKATKAGADCGICLDDLRGMLRRAAAKRDAAAQDGKG